MVDDDIKELRRKIKSNEKESSTHFDTTLEKREIEHTEESTEDVKNIDRVTCEIDKEDVVEDNKVEEIVEEETTNDKWNCDYCDKEFNGEQNAKNHEHDCSKNPDNQIKEYSTTNSTSTSSSDLNLNFMPIIMGIISLGVVLTVGWMVISEATAALENTTIMTDTLNVSGISELLPFSFALPMILIAVFMLFPIVKVFGNSRY